MGGGGTGNFEKSQPFGLALLILHARGRLPADGRRLVEIDAHGGSAQAERLPRSATVLIESSNAASKAGLEGRAARLSRMTTAPSTQAQTQALDADPQLANDRGVVRGGRSDLRTGSRFRWRTGTIRRSGRAQSRAQTTGQDSSGTQTGGSTSQDPVRRILLPRTSRAARPPGRRHEGPHDPRAAARRARAPADLRRCSGRAVEHPRRRARPADGAPPPELAIAAAEAVLRACRPLELSRFDPDSELSHGERETPKPVAGQLSGVHGRRGRRSRSTNGRTQRRARWNPDS